MRRNNYQPQALSVHASPFQVSYENTAHIQNLLNEEGLLGLIYFGHQKVEVDDSRIITVELPELSGRATVEVWRAPRTPEIGYDGDGGIWYSRTDSVLFGYLQFEEDQFSGLEQATYHAYRSILTCQQRLGYPYLLRTWNYLPDIHREEDGLERYRAFCLGRHRILEATPNFERHLVAATTMGTDTPRMLVYFLAAIEPGLRVENPRQVSAFHYPFRYAPRSPSFSRATLKQWGTEAHLYVSGTASIVGHETQHVGNPLAQLDETLNNLQALTENAQRLHRLKIKTLSELSLLKVYLRRGIDVVSIARCLQERLGDSVPALFLQGDICRNDLLLEIEAFYVESLIAAR
ncbi:MAG: chorismate transformation enzyme, FkbO/Hyg5 family [Candidatus Nitrosoglobus sp.]